METLAPPNSETTKPLPQVEEIKLPEGPPQDFSVQECEDLISGIEHRLFPTANSSEGVDPGETGDAEVDRRLESLDSAAAELASETMRKVSSRLGSNEGGWYERSSSGERLYLKFYSNPNQTRVEFIANSIYARLGIKAVKSELIDVDGREAVASPEIPNPQATYLEEQRASTDVRDGFVADAFLANWDVVGLSYDNIVQGEGGMYRIDNGGSLIFRAQGGSKEFSPDDIPELRTMLNPDFTAGQVFEGITEQEMAEQARNLVEHLDVNGIDAIIAESGITGETATEIRNGLVGRRKFLIQRFGLGKGETEIKQGESRLGSALERLYADAEKSKELGMRSEQAIVCDGGHIENQEIKLIDARDAGHLGVSFKLTSEQYQLVLDRMAELSQSGESTVSNGELSYRKLDKDEEFSISPAYEISQNGIKIKIARPPRPEDGEKNVLNRTAIGLVYIEIPQTDSDEKTAEEIEVCVNEALINLGVPEGLDEPNPEAENQYKEARYRWHHKLPFGPLTQEQNQELARLVRREVFPGHHTMVSEGKSKEYEATYGEFALYHRTLDSKHVVDIFRNGGILSQIERQSRGLDRGGMDSGKDSVSGGADSVFLRTVLSGSPGNTSLEDCQGYRLVLNPELYDRTDWYAYLYDRYGTTDEQAFQERQSPSQLLEEQQSQGFSFSNEQMFRTGVSSESIRGIQCNENQDVKLQVMNALQTTPEEIENLWNQGPDKIRETLRAQGIEQIDDRSVQDLMAKDDRLLLIDQLHQAGITDINGVGVNEFIFKSGLSVDAVIDIAHGRPPRSRSV